MELFKKNSLLYFSQSPLEFIDMAQMFASVLQLESNF